MKCETAADSVYFTVVFFTLHKKNGKKRKAAILIEI